MLSLWDLRVLDTENRLNRHLIGASPAESAGWDFKGTAPGRVGVRPDAAALADADA